MWKPVKPTKSAANIYDSKVMLCIGRDQKSAAQTGKTINGDNNLSNWSKQLLKKKALNFKLDTKKKIFTMIILIIEWFSLF